MARGRRLASAEVAIEGLEFRYLIENVNTIQSLLYHYAP